MRRNLMRGTLLLAVGLALTGCAWLVAPAPQAVLTATQTTGTAPLDVTFDLSASTGDITSWTLSFGDGTMETGTTLATVDHTYAYDDTATYPKTYTATLTVQDSRGRTSTATRTITVSALATVTAELGAENTMGPAPLVVTFKIKGQPPAGKKIVRWHLAFGDGNEIEQFVNLSSLDTTTSHEYAIADDYEAVLTVEDEDGATASDTVTVTVTSGPPEITDFTVDNVPGTGTTTDPYVVDENGDVEFSFEATADAGREIVKWQLVFGDGVSVTQEGFSFSALSVSYIYDGYEQTGSYTAIARVWDNVDKMATESVEIEVE